MENFMRSLGDDYSTRSDPVPEICWQAEPAVSSSEHTLPALDNSKPIHCLESRHDDSAPELWGFQPAILPHYAASRPYCCQWKPTAATRVYVLNSRPDYYFPTISSILPNTGIIAFPLSCRSF
jgi:hypothetical protein